MILARQYEIESLYKKFILEEKLYLPAFFCQPGSLYLPNRFYNKGWNHNELLEMGNFLKNFKRILSSITPGNKRLKYLHNFRLFAKV